MGHRTVNRRGVTLPDASALLDKHHIQYDVTHINGRDELLVNDWDVPRANRLLLDYAPLQVPYRWGSYTARGDAIIREQANRVAGELTERSLVRFARWYWRNVYTDTKQARENGWGDTAVREVVYGFIEDVGRKLAVGQGWDGVAFAEKVYEDARSTLAH